MAMADWQYIERLNRDDVSANEMVGPLIRVDISCWDGVWLVLYLLSKLSHAICRAHSGPMSLLT